MQILPEFSAPPDEVHGLFDMTHQLECHQIITLIIKFKFSLTSMNHITASNTMAINVALQYKTGRMI